MFPSLSFNDEFNVGGANIKLSAKYGMHSVLLWCRVPSFKYFENLSFRKFAGVDFGSLCVPAFVHCVMMVLLWCTKKQMVRIAAQRCVAGMAHDKSLLYWLSKQQLHNKAMHTLGFSVNKNSAVAINKSAALPYKTLSHALGMAEQFA